MSQPIVLTTNEQKLNDAWEEHLRTEFNAHSADDAIARMVPTRSSIRCHDREARRDSTVGGRPV